ncbi:MAG: AraC family transcriptional regulator [Verrucomicrobiota bacterium]
MAKAGSLIAFRSGAHMMSEFRAGEDCYRSFVISFERDFLKQVIGMPSEAGIDPPRSTVAVNISQAHWRQLCRMPSSINTFESETEKEFRLREFVFLAMADPVVRSMFYYDMADWGVSIEHRITSVLHAHYLSPLRVSELAQLCGMSLASYKRYFRDTFNTSPGEWLHRKRLDHAYGLAKRGDLMTQEICEACGYQDVSSFIRAFSRRFGKTPRAISQIE